MYGLIGQNFSYIELMDAGATRTRELEAKSATQVSATVPGPCGTHTGDHGTPGPTKALGSDKGTPSPSGAQTTGSGPSNSFSTYR